MLVGCPSDPVQLSVSCSSPRSTCDTACVDLQSNALNCGACGRECASAESCVMGACRVSCSAGQTACGTTCVDLQSNARNCGDCANHVRRARDA
nr:hypothetical protein [Deltaproteobacteria bacterium]